MIPCGRNRLLNETAPAMMPNAGPSMNGWQKPITLQVITTRQVGFQAKEEARQVDTVGVCQPLSKRRLEVKPEGERKWEWKELHVDPEVILSPGMYVVIGNVKYRVMANSGYQDNGYVEYELINAATARK